MQHPRGEKPLGRGPALDLRCCQLCPTVLPAAPTETGTATKRCHRQHRQPG